MQPLLRGGLTRIWFYDLAAFVIATHRTYPVRQPRAVALWARVVRRGADLVLRPATGCAGMGLLLLWNGHRPASVPRRESAPMVEPRLARPGGLSKAQLGELGPALIGLTRPVCVLGAGRVEVRAALDAQAGAVGAAQDLRRKRERQRVACPGAQVQDLAVQIRRAKVGIAARLRHLARVDRKRWCGGLEAAHARPG